MRFSSAPSTWASKALSSGVTKRSAPTIVCRRSQPSGTEVQVGAGDLEEVAEHPGVADLEALDAGAGPLAPLELHQRAPAVGGQGDERVQLLRVARPDEAALVEVRRRRVHQRRAAARSASGSKPRERRRRAVRQSSARHPSSAAARSGSTARLRPRPARSRGVPSPVASRPRMRSTSATCRRSPAQASRQTALVDSSSTASWRARMASRSRSGASSHSTSRRAPSAVTVRSTTPSSDPAREPSRIVRRTSRLVRVVSSSTSVDSSGTRRSAWTWRASVRWVSFR